MKLHFLHYLSIGALIISNLFVPVATANTKVAPANGIALPENYKDWRVISMSHRTDNKTVRIILGNDIAIKAARSKQTNPWPDGTVIGKMVWKEMEKKTWPSAIVPDQFIHAEFMIKDTEKFKANGTGWGWARWLSTEQKPYGNAKDHDQSCITCHTPVKDNDWVFTTPAVMP